MVGIQRFWGYDPVDCTAVCHTRWVAQTRGNYVSVTPYNYTDTKVHGFQGIHQPATVSDWEKPHWQVVVVLAQAWSQLRTPRDMLQPRPRTHDAKLSPRTHTVDAIEGGSIFAERGASA